MVNSRKNPVVDQIDVEMHADVLQKGSTETWATVVSKFEKKTNGPIKKMSSKQIEVVNSVLNEDKEREKRKNNLLIFGLNKEEEEEEESVSDLTAKVTSLFELIGADKKSIAMTRRFRPTSQNSVPPVLVHLNNTANRNGIL